MKTTFSSSPTSIKLFGERIEGALDRHQGIAGFDQEKHSRSHVLCIGAGGLISNIAPTLCRKGIGKLTILDDDLVEASNLNRQRFYPKDIGKNKAIALVENLQSECTFSTQLIGYSLRLEEAIQHDVLDCDVVICGVDNNPARISACSFFRKRNIPVIFTAVSANADHGYVFIQDTTGPCWACVFPDSIDDHRFPCPRAPAMADILQAVGAVAVYAIDAISLERPRKWNCFRLSLSGVNSLVGCSLPQRRECQMCRPSSLRFVREST